MLFEILNQVQDDVLFVIADALLVIADALLVIADALLVVADALFVIADLIRNLCLQKSPNSKKDYILSNLFQTQRFLWKILP
jgi:hypothetical protein